MILYLFARQPTGVEGDSSTVPAHEEESHIHGNAHVTNVAQPYKRLGALRASRDQFVAPGASSYDSLVLFFVENKILPLAERVQSEHNFSQ